VDLETVADELYGLPPEDFVAARTAREKAARTAGDRVLAGRIRALTKPNQVAWLANQLARRHGEELAPLLDLGAGLRAAEGALTGDQLRDFTQQKRRLVAVLVQQAKQLAAAEGRKASQDTLRGVETTLNAALADESAAAQLRAARLSTGLEHSGFGSAPAGLATVIPLRPSTAPERASPPGGAAGTPVGDPRRGRRAAAERTLAAARRSEEEADATRAEAETALDAADLALAGAEADVERLRESLVVAERSSAKAAGQRRRTRKALEAARRDAERAVRRRLDAERLLSALPEVTELPEAPADE